MDKPIKFSSDLSKNLWIDFCLNLSIVSFMAHVELMKEKDSSFDEKEFKRELINKWIGNTNELMKSQINDHWEKTKNMPKSAFSNLTPSPDDLTENSVKALKEVRAAIEKVLFKNDQN